MIAPAPNAIAFTCTTAAAPVDACWLKLDKVVERAGLLVGVPEEAEEPDDAEREAAVEGRIRVLKLDPEAEPATAVG